MEYLFWVNCFVWCGIGGYVLFLVLKLKGLSKEIEDIQSFLKTKKE